MKKIFLLLAALTIIIPIVLIILFSLFSYYRFPLLLPQHFTTMFWKTALFHNPLFISSILNSLILAICNGILSTIVGVMTARALVRHDFKGKKLLKILYAIPLFIPAIALFLGVHTVMIRLRLMNSYKGIILAHMIISVPYAISIFIAFFKGINIELEDAAKVLGCKPLCLYSKIIIPLIAPGIFLSFSIGFLISFTEYFSTFLIGGGRVITLAILMYPYINNFDVGNGAVLAVIFIGSNLLIFYVAEYVSKKKLKINSYLFE
ncbi:ABC transporter permease [Clostridium formicaceticum]|uniref:Trehalose transport system permease protein SugB n=1 Tax=Clostridium formicaceticum TaxID=1497 RepID=A0AAC9WH38_9CLOT|nr:ABC transporter permease subunit [Clostridium formicaceticum]AOY77828.1 hypothetical protein BJL90_19360 [Clostridium formicaceticum]ARE88439.1 Trehalose transport system permease protein SugB [Clostridium formicaceticum]